MSHSRTLILDIETNTKHDTIWCCVTKDIYSGEVNVWTEVKSFIFSEKVLAIYAQT
jgi:hypothetical protein